VKALCPESFHGDKKSSKKQQKLFQKKTALSSHLIEIEWIA
jgi:hypothetical protein